MFDSNVHTNPPRSSERNFGVVFCVVFLIIGCWPLLGGASPRWIFLFFAGALLLIAWVKPKWLEQPNYYWYKIGILLGAIVAPLVMAVVFVITVVPIGLIAKMLGKDLLDTQLDKSVASYWKVRTEPMQPFDKQY